jgi:hypothetical protein
MEVAAVAAAILVFVLFRQWLRHQRRVLIHKERLAAIEKGVDLPALPEEPDRGRINVQRILLLSGLVWMAIGIGALSVGKIILADPAIRTEPSAPPVNAYLAGVIPLLVGVAHLIVYAVDRRANR